MQPAEKFHGIVVLLTAIIVFALVSWVKPLIDGFATVNTSLVVLANVLSTIGVYTLLAK